MPIIFEKVKTKTDSSKKKQIAKSKSERKKKILRNFSKISNEKEKVKIKYHKD